MIKLANLYGQYLTLKDEIDAAIARTIQHSAYIGGEAVESFESDFSAYVGAKYCVAVGNGTDALEIALEALEIHNHSIVVPAMSAVPTVEAVVRTGNRPVFCDIDASYTLDTRRVMPLCCVDFDIDAIIPVHLYGAPADLDGVLEIAARNGLAVIEDCAQAHGTYYDGQHVGTLGDIGCFSFYPSKNLGAYGDAGAIVTNDTQLAKRCKMLRNHGRSSKFAHKIVGRNSRMDGLQATILSVKLKHLDEWTALRQRHAAIYDKWFAGRVLLPNWKGRRVSYHQYPVCVTQRTQVQKKLRERGIATGVHYPFVLSQVAPYKDDETYPHAERLAAEELSLPVHEMLTDEEIEYVAKTLLEIIDG